MPIKYIAYGCHAWGTGESPDVAVARALPNAGGGTRTFKVGFFDPPAETVTVGPLGNVSWTGEEDGEVPTLTWSETVTWEDHEDEDGTYTVTYAEIEEDES